MRKSFIITILFSISYHPIIAQEFEKAPLPKVKTIIEWVQDPTTKKVKKGMTYEFNRKGQITKYMEKGEDGYPGESGVFVYDGKNRLKEKEIQYGYNNTITKIGYAKNYHVEVIEFKDSQYKNFYYRNKKKKLSEMKSFIANYDTEYKFQLFDRTVYKYDSKGRLVGEKHYHYWNVRDKKAKPNSKARLYKFTSKGGSLKKIEDYGYKGELNDVVSFEYDKRGKITKKTHDFLNGKIETTTFKYQKGKLWVETFDEGNVVITKIYKNDRLIRKRKKWNGGKEEIIDFQYKFY